MNLKRIRAVMSALKENQEHQTHYENNESLG